MYRQRFIDPICERGSALSGTSSSQSCRPERGGDLPTISGKRGLLPARTIAASMLLYLGLHSFALAQTSSSPPAPNPAAPAKPACDVSCIRENSDRAARFCAPRIEAQAPTDFEWINRPFGNIFQEAEPSPENAAVVRYRGDSIRFLSPQREWTRVSYECVFDTTQDKIATVNVRLGRLNAPATPPPAAQGANAAPQQSNAQPNPPPAKQSLSAATAPNHPKVKPGEPSPIEILQVSPRSGQVSR
jgi:hypothetical protein